MIVSKSFFIYLVLIFPLLVDLVIEYPRVKFNTVDEEHTFTSYLFVRILPVVLIYITFRLFSRDLNFDVLTTLCVFAYSEISFLLSGMIIKKIYMGKNYTVYSEEWLMTRFLKDMLYFCFLGGLAFVSYFIF